MWQHRAKVESSHIQCLAATLGVLKQPFICIISLHILFPNYIKEHKRQVSFRLSLGAARYLAKECDKDQKVTTEQLCPITQRHCGSRQKRAPWRETSAAGVTACVTAGPDPHGGSLRHDFTRTCYSLAFPRVIALHPGLPEPQARQHYSYKMPELCRTSGKKAPCPGNCRCLSLLGRLLALAALAPRLLLHTFMF